MGIRPTNDPYGGVNPLIDKMIGNAFDIVKYVAANLRTIRYVAENMETVFHAAQNMQAADTGGGGANNVIVLAGQGNGTDSMILDLPNGLTADEVYGLNFMLQGDAGAWVPNPGSNFASAGIFADTSAPDYIAVNFAMSAFYNARFRIVLFTGPASPPSGGL